MTGSTFEVGPGKEYASLRDVPWDSLEPGDLVLVYPQDEPYRDKIQISRSGTPESPIQIRGVSVDGEIPIIDGNGAIENPQASYTYDGFAAMGVFTFVHDKAGNGPPEHVLLANLELRGAHQDSPLGFTNAEGEQRWWWKHSSGVAMYYAKHIVLSSLVIHSNGNGIFSLEAEDITLRCSQIHGNGVLGDDKTHNIYLENLGTLIEFTDFGPLLEGAGGNNIKDRSAGLVFRYNRVQGGTARLMDLVETNNATIADDPTYADIFIYGNILHRPNELYPNKFIHVGSESGKNRRLNTHFYANTVLSHNNQSETGAWKVALFALDTDEESVYAYNNCIASLSGDPNAWSGWWHLAWVYYSSSVTLHLGKNFTTTYEDVPGLHGAENVIVGDDPGWEDWQSGNFTLAADSQCRSAAGEFHPATATHPVEWQPLSPLVWVPRMTFRNLGAIER